jgi:signal transduction histidine kinase/CheY-like chemotaxis protein
MIFRFSKIYRCLLFCLALCPGIGSDQCIAQQPVAAGKGIIDLRETDLRRDPVSLSGDWAFNWHQLVSPNDSTTSPQAFVHFPALWEKTTVNGLLLPSTGYASYRVTVLLPKHTNKLALEVPDTYTSYRLFVNGREFSAAGNPDSVQKNAVPKWIYRTLEITSPGDTLHLLMHVANYWHSKGGPYKDIFIGDRDMMLHKRDVGAAYDLLLTGCLFMGGLFFLGLFLFGRHDKSILFFALFAMTYSYRIIGARQYVLHDLFPNIPWWLGVHLEYLTLFISIAFFSLYTRYLYPRDASKTIMRAQVILCLLLSAVVLVAPPAIFTQLISAFLVVMFGVIGYAFYVYIQAMRNKRIGAGYALMSTGVVLLVFIVINLQYFGIVKAQKGILFAGYIAFFFLQSLILSFRFAYALKQAKIEAEQGLKAKNEFLSTMSHEIRTPLNSILGMTHLILRDNPSSGQREQLNVLLFSANNLLAIVNDILDYNKIEAGKVNFEAIDMDLVAVIKNIHSGLRNAADEKGIELRLDIDPALKSRIIGDPTRTAQVLTNLVSNAIKFTRKGHVMLQVKVESLTDQSITLTFNIEDTGIGIAQEKQKLIFEQFTQADTSTSRNFGGTGLGLAICKKLLALQGAELQLRSAPDKGSCFYFTQTFPKAAQTALVANDAADLMPTEESKPLLGISILLVEDNEVNVLVARTFLERWGAKIDVATNGQEALDMLDTKKHRLVLMDMHMPVMDGYEATRRIREKGITLPVVALTASLPKEVEDRVKGMGVDDIIVKPFVPEDLFRVVLHYTGVYRSNKGQQ